MKELKKTSGIRFKVSEVDLVKKRESLKTLQEVYDFLIYEYMKLYKVEKPSIFISEKESDYDGKSEREYIGDEVGLYEQPTDEEIFKGYEYYQKKAKDVEFEDAESLIIEIMASSMKLWQQNLLKQYINSKFDFS